MFYEKGFVIVACALELTLDTIIFSDKNWSSVSNHFQLCVVFLSVYSNTLYCFTINHSCFIIMLFLRSFDILKK